MDQQIIVNGVRRLIAREFNVKEDTVRLDAALLEYEPDSLDTIELTLALEECFEVDIPDEDVETLRTVQDIVTYIGKKLGANGANAVDA